jgi:ankyrin repeat protein
MSKVQVEPLKPVPVEAFDRAVREGDAGRVRALLAQHAELRTRINEPRFDFDSPAIHQAKKHLSVVDALLEHGADINARSKFWAGGFGILEWNLTLDEARPLIKRGATITVWAAAGLGLIDELRSILSEHPEAARERGGDGKTALHCAATPEIAELLIAHGADLNVRDTDHEATPLQYLIGDEAVCRLLIERGAEPDIFVAARLGDPLLVKKCLQKNPAHAEAHVGHPPFTAPGGHIYIWSLGQPTPAETARHYNHGAIADLILSLASPRARLLDALWCADRERVNRELELHPTLVSELAPGDHALVAEAAWQHRLESIRLMLELGFNPHARTVHQSTPLDRASFHGYADIVTLLLKMDPQPPLTLKNEFGGMPLGACIYGSMHGWNTGHPQDHARTAQLLLEAGAAIDPAWLPTGNDDIDVVLRARLTSESGPQ